MTLRIFATQPATMPEVAAWYLADLGEAKGRQELFAKQSPQRLKTLREHALIESAVSSNRIEGITSEQDRIRPLRKLGNSGDTILVLLVQSYTLNQTLLF